MSARRISVFGATGSVGRSTLDLVARDPEGCRVVALTAHSDAAALAAAAIAHRAELAVVADPAGYAALKDALATSGVEVAAGAEALIDAARRDADWTMAAIVGCAGLEPTLAALEQGRVVALANKESLVSAGALMMRAGGRIGRDPAARRQ